ncbi:Hydroxymethylglutaryl-CoA lyase YngG (plasmid) [Variovorax sp. SRS16]|uniref:hydroxymethylglutaryl-CoA lyase n=1 Tax=Variovorax sp. SRS16 TaxID=282217 RepID=UPI001317ED23|nr:hydroxymethylglutaryl-CoA lyase [Variovorax sp. SRS16]VTU45635.1 Hydroxymethylglutaryl-CoA lyase YngG [Variovorax sp. SRS16]
MSDLPKTVSIKEEGPREGFQFEKGAIPAARKIALIDSLSQTGLKQIQTVSFVPAKNVPGMADADEVVQGFHRAPGVSYTALWLNERGLERAIGTAGKLDIKGILTLTASEKFLLRNQKRTLAENLAALQGLVAMYKKHAVPVERISIAAAFGCNFEGDIPVATVVDMTRQLLDIGRQHGLGIKVLSLADTMAWATPMSIRRVVGAVREAFPELQLSLHLHDTRGMGIANAYAGLEMGVALFDAAVGGLGGCPFAAHSGAAGNVCTEDLVFMCDEMGITSGVDLEALLESARLAEEIVGHPLPGAVKSGGSLRRLRKKIAGEAVPA